MSTEARARALLEERARALAAPKAPLSLDASHTQLVVFSRSGVSYALDTRFVLEVTEVATYTPLPGAPAYNLGLTFARGVLLPLFDLSALLSSGAPKEPPRYMLLCGERNLELGLAVDAALGLVSGAGLLEAGAHRTSLISAVGPTGFSLIDGHRLLSDPRFSCDFAQRENGS